MTFPPLPWRHSASGHASQGSIWQCLPLERVEDGVLWLSRGGGSTPVAVVEVEGISLLLRTDQHSQYQERFRRFLLALEYPLQILVRSEPASACSLVQSVIQDLASKQGEDVPLLQADRAFLSQLLGGQETLRHRVYLIVSAEASVPPLGRMGPWSPPHRRRREQQAELRLQLEERVQAGLQLLTSLGLPARRLQSREAMLDLLYQLFHPQRARQVALPQAPAPELGWLEPGQELAWIAPAGLRVTARELLLGADHLIRHWIVRSWPRQVKSLWLWPLLVATPFELEVSFHLVPVPRTSAQRLLRRKLLEYRSLLLYAQDQQRVRDPLVTLAHQDVERLLDEVGTGQEQLFLTSVYLALHASSSAQLEERSARLESLLRLLDLWAVPALYEQVSAWQSCLPWRHDQIKAGVLLDSQSLATCFPFLSPTLLQPGGRFEGVTVSESTPVLLDPWASNWRNANRLIIGASGSGKSFKCKLDIVHALTMPPAQARPDERPPDEASIQVIVIDPEGEYLPLCEALGGQHVRLAVGLPGSGEGGVNPFVLPRPADRAGDVLAEQIQWLLELLELLLGKEQPLTASECSLLERALLECYRERGITADPQTHHHIEPPLLRDLSRVLRSGVCGPDTSSLADRLCAFTSGSAAALFEPRPLELEGRLTVFDLSGLGSLRAIGQYLVVQLIWRLARSSPRPRLLIVDELWSLFASTGPGGRLLLEQLFQRARKYYLAIYGITQHPRILQDSSILANCASVLLLGQEPASLSKLAELLHLSEEEARVLVSLNKGEGLLLLGEQHHLHLRFPAEPTVAQVITTDPRQRERVQPRQTGKGDSAHELHS